MKKVRFFRGEKCRSCIETTEILKERGVDVETILIEGSSEWEEVMEKTGVYFVPHFEVTWDGGEVHISQSRDFVRPSESVDKLMGILSNEYVVKKESNNQELNERIKTLEFMVEHLYKYSNKVRGNFTNIKEFINLPSSKIEE
tara:strand:- start:2915 stop:3343 length:429 start_codon:yes stop_codon:yes gene_type:complete